MLEASKKGFGGQSNWFLAVAAVDDKHAKGKFK
jgi:hypothetical protein